MIEGLMAWQGDSTAGTEQHHQLFSACCFAPVVFRSLHNYI